ncbi:DNA mismatch repair protein MLH3 [Grifola frondosa]|uniref:DNA mismatch repair protein MLH3 n=1 Tax=Grifola frondosa TaxID=5627 RepID=A0A1C7MHU6_GRIFR|nr:DNA mismatch repair protein MLH3 [Grifola frondosa]
MESEEVRCAFERWGVGFVRLEEMEAGDEREYVQVMVSSVPEVVSDKLLMGDELRDLVKGFLARLEVEGTAALLNAVMSDARGSDGEATERQFIWQKALRWCPKELLELVNSKACRGAIMFNDPLTLEQCERLVRELAETALPFQCAHGRPSLCHWRRCVETGALVGDALSRQSLGSTAGEVPGGSVGDRDRASPSQTVVGTCVTFLFVIQDPDDIFPRDASSVRHWSFMKTNTHHVTILVSLHATSWDRSIDFHHLS